MEKKLLGLGVVAGEPVCNSRLRKSYLILHFGTAKTKVFAFSYERVRGKS
jgi:hypothetical protein